MKLSLVIVAALSLLQDPRLNVRIITDEADAVLARDWNAVASSEGYRRLKDREAGMQRAIVDSAFRAFVLSDELQQRAPALKATLTKWSRLDAGLAGQKALAYLPSNAQITARIYPVIKPRSNSFVWDADTNPAIFLYVDPKKTEAQFQNTLTHELHHIGYSNVCKQKREGVAGYAGTFGEGRAVLAAAGSPFVHPHAVSPDSERVVWDRDFAKVASDMQRMERYFSGIHDGSLSEKQADEQWMQFVAPEGVPQGAFYTVGYLMARTVEEQLGRARLVATLCDPISFMKDYNEAATRAAKKSAKTLPVWSSDFLTRLSARPAPRISLATIQKASTLADSAQKAYREKRYVESAQQYERAAVMPGYPGAGSAWYNAACSWALAGDAAKALIALQKTVDAGWHNAAHAKVDTDLVILHNSAEYARIVAQMETIEKRIATERADLNKVKLVTSDITNFWRAYDMAAAETSFVAKRNIFEREYLGRASPGLLDYYFSKIKNLDNMTRFVTKQKRFYDSVRPQTLRTNENAEQIRSGLKRLQDLYPEATFPDVYFVIGTLTSGGTASSNGMLIGTEMYSATKSTPKDELPSGIARIMGTSEQLPNTVVHELVHYLQRGGNATLLSGAIREGTAVYLAEIAMPMTTQPYFMTWGAAHENEVRERFLKEQDSSDWSQWIGNNGSASEEWPADLGYFIGYRIAENYVNRAADRKQAIRDLLLLQDPKVVLQRSGYANEVR
ncbi:MAG TPA: DUF5700 domain-containing putative Zn-dependent protease [Longimicrobiales bacterium]|nr:DUF5700 domain-containing putative Zn-dependent protease [Longimicrobiales bacterium]